MQYHQARPIKNIYTLPIICLLIYIVLTFCPLIYRFLPILGHMRMVLLSGSVMLIAYLLNQSRYTNSAVYKNPVIYLWAALLCIMTLGIAVSLDRGQTISLIGLNVKYFIVFLVMVKIIDSHERLDLLVGVFVLCAIGMALSSIYHYVSGSSAHMLGGLRVLAITVGIFGDPNDLALFLNAALPLALYRAIKSARKPIPVLGVIVIVAAIMLTYSRGGFLGLCMNGLGFFLFFASKQKKYIVPLLIMAVLFWAVAPQSYKDRIGTITDVKTDSATGMTGTRLDAWRIVVANTTNWILGTGAGNSMYIAGSVMGDWHTLHNSFLQVFVELGIIALFLYLGLFIKPYKQLRFYLKRHRQRMQKSDIVLVKAILISFMSFGITLVFLPQAYSAILYTLSGIAVIQTELIRKKLVAAARQLSPR